MGTERGLQEIVDALSLRLGRPVLIDDVELRPLAYSAQWGDLDAVRTSSILGRLAPEAARIALFDEGIRTAVGPVRIPAHPDIDMRPRLCVPLVGGGRRLGYLWLIEDPPVSPDELRVARAAAAEAAAQVAPDADAQSRRRRREGELLAALLGADADRAAAAVAELDADHYLPQRPLRLWAAVSRGAAGDEWPADVLERLRARLPAKQVLCGEVDGHVICLTGGSALAREAVAEVLRRAPAPGLIVGEGDAVEELRDSRIAHRRALAALRVALHGDGSARWDDLGADRVVAALPAAALADLPAGLVELLNGSYEPLVTTLAAYLDHAGDAQGTAAALSLHRGGLYYRLRRIEEIAGVDLHVGEDRLLCHLALRLARLSAA